MSRAKLPRKSTHIDMTAMCDVAFLLLTFFMLATKFKPDEPVIVRTPNSISEIMKPENSILLTMDKEGRVFFDYDNKKAKVDMIKTISEEKGLKLSPEELENFKIGSSVGLPFSELKSYLALGGLDKKEYTFTGIPVNPLSANGGENELVYWVQAARTAGQSIGEPPRICIKADAETPYPKVKLVISSLVKNQIDRFNLITNAKAVPPGTSAWDEKFSASK